MKFFYNTNVFPSSTVIVIIKPKLKEVLTVLQMALESEEQEMRDSQHLQQLALLQIVISKPSEEEVAKKIIDGITLPEVAPLKIQLSTESIPQGHVMVTRMASSALTVGRVSLGGDGRVRQHREHLQPRKQPLQKGQLHGRQVRPGSLRQQKLPHRSR